MCVLDVLCIVWRVHGVYTVCVCGVRRVFTQKERKSHVDQMVKTSVQCPFPVQISCGPRSDNLVFFHSRAISHMFHHLRHDMINFLRFCCTIDVVTCARNLLLAPMFVHVGLVPG